MIRKILFLLPILAALFATSCKKDDTLKPFSISPQDIVFSAAGDSSYVSVYGDKERWTLHFGKQGSDALCSFNSAFTEFTRDGKGRTEAIKIYSRPNTLRENKYDTLYLEDLTGKYGTIKVKLTISAVSIVFNTINNDSVYYAPKESNDFKIKLQTNVDKINFDGVPSDLDYSYIGADSMLIFTLPENKNIRTITYNVTLKGNWTEPEKTRTINFSIIQDGYGSVLTDETCLRQLNTKYNLGWVEGTAVSTWVGVGFSPVESSRGIEQRVTALDLSKRMLTGELPTELNDLEYIRALRLNNNKFSGEIPEDFYNFPELETLWLGNNELEGTLSENIGKLKNMRNLSIINTSISGTIPQSISEFKNLTSLELSGNRFTGTLPEKLGELKTMLIFTVSGNNLTGDVPLTYKNNINWYYWNPTVNIFPQRDGVILK